MTSRLMPMARSLFGVALLTAAPLAAQSNGAPTDPPGEWHNYNRDLGSSR